MRKIIYGIIAAVVLIGAGCTINGGDIGPLYGVWMLDELKVNGELADVDVERYSFRFQKDIAQIGCKYPHNEFEVYTCTWKKSEKELTLKFRHANLPEELGMPKDTTIVLGIESETAKTLVLNYDNADNGNKYTYSLRKLE